MSEMQVNQPQTENLVKPAKGKKPLLIVVAAVVLVAVLATVLAVVMPGQMNADVKEMRRAATDAAYENGDPSNTYRLFAYRAYEDAAVLNLPEGEVWADVPAAGYVFIINAEYNHIIFFDQEKQVKLALCSKEMEELNQKVSGGSWWLADELGALADIYEYVAGMVTSIRMGNPDFTLIK